MERISGDRVQETFTTTGTGTISLGGAAIGYQAFAALMLNNDICDYTATDGTNWEVGVGTYGNAGNTLARTIILSSSNSGSAVNWGVGTKNIWLDAPALRFTPPVIHILTVGSGTFTADPGAIAFRVKLCGSGGGGGNASAGGGQSAAGSGGGAGLTGESIISSATMGVSQSYTVGAGGSAASAGNTTTLGALMSATGGAAGNTGSGSTGYGITGGLGASTSSGCTIVITGGDGFTGGCQAFNSNMDFGGNGGASYFGSGGTGGAAGNGSNGRAYGSGGGGGGAAPSQSVSGGTGANGIIIIEAIF